MASASGDKPLDQLSSSSSLSSANRKERFLNPTLVAGACEFVRVSRTGRLDDFLNSAIGGFGTGAILGRLQVVGTTVYYATIKIKPALKSFYDSIVNSKDDWLKLPEWLLIQVLDKEALAAKHAREEQIYKSVHNLNKKDS